MSSSDDSESAAPLGRGLGRTGGRSWMSRRLGRSKKGPDQVRAQLFLCGNGAMLACALVLQIQIVRDDNRAAGSLLFAVLSLSRPRTHVQ